MKAKIAAEKMAVPSNKYRNNHNSKREFADHVDDDDDEILFHHIYNINAVVL